MADTALLLQESRSLKPPIFNALLALLAIDIYYTLSKEPTLLFVISVCFPATILGFCAYRFFADWKFAPSLKFIGQGLGFFSVTFLICKIHTDLKYIEPNIDGTVVEALSAKIIEIIPKRGHKSCFIASRRSNGKARICTYSPYATKISIGDTVVFTQTKLEPLPRINFEGDYQFARLSFFSGVSSLGFAKSVWRCEAPIPRSLAKFCPDIPQDLTLLDKINRFRRRQTQELVGALGEEAGGITSAIVFGERSHLTEEIKNSMKMSSIFHLVAISGLHISLISLFAYKLTARLIYIAFRGRLGYFVIKRIAILNSLALAAIYLIFSGSTLSAQRAFIMFLVAAALSLMGKTVSGKKTLVMALFTVIILEPYALLNAGLQMSFMAVASLVFFDQSRIKRALNKFLKLSPLGFLPYHAFRILGQGIISVSLPHLAILPFTLYYFGSFSTYNALANLIAIPLATAVIMPLILLYLAFRLDFLAFLLKKSIFLLIEISNFFAHLPGGYFSAHAISGVAFAFLILGSLIFLALESRNRLIGISLYSLGLCLSLRNPWPQYFIYQERGKINIVVREGQRLLALSQKSRGYLSLKILEKNSKSEFGRLETENFAAGKEKSGTFQVSVIDKSKILLQGFGRSEVFTVGELKTSGPISIDKRGRVKAARDIAGRRPWSPS